MRDYEGLEEITFAVTPEGLDALGYFGVVYVIVLAGIFCFKWNLGLRYGPKLWAYFFEREWAEEVREAVCGVAAILCLYAAFF